MFLEEAKFFTSDQVTSAIKSYRSSRAYGLDSLSIFSEPRTPSYRTPHSTLSIWKTSLIIPIPKPGKKLITRHFLQDPSRCYAQLPRSLKVLILPSINKFLSPAKDQHGFRPRHSTTSDLLQLTTDIETGFNQRKPPHRIVWVAIDLTADFDTVSHDTLISKIAGSSLSPAITRLLSCYLRGRQAATSFRGTKLSTRNRPHRRPSRDDMPRPTPPVKRVCYADDITVWATGPRIPQLEVHDQHLPERSKHLPEG